MDYVLPMMVDHTGARQLQNQQPPPSGSSNVDGTIAIVVIVTAVFLIIWSPALVRRCRSRANSNRYGLDASGQRLSEAYLEAVVMRRLSELNRSRANHPHRMTERDRREYIANVLLPRRVVLDSTNKADVPPTRDTSRRGKPDLKSYHLSTPSKHGQTDDDEYCCAICLIDYKNDDEVCLSNNKYCNHFFHRACISEWLLTHEECPCCRHFFLFFVENERDLELFEGRSEGERHERAPSARPPQTINDLPDVEAQRPAILSGSANQEQRSAVDETHARLSNASPPGASVAFAAPDHEDRFHQGQQSTQDPLEATRTSAASEHFPSPGGSSAVPVPRTILEHGLQMFHHIRSNLTYPQGNQRELESVSAQAEVAPETSHVRPEIQEIEA